MTIRTVLIRSVFDNRYEDWSCFNSGILDISPGQTFQLTCVATSSASLGRASFRTSYARPVRSSGVVLGQVSLTRRTYSFKLYFLLRLSARRIAFASLRTGDRLAALGSPEIIQQISLLTTRPLSGFRLRASSVGSRTLWIQSQIFLGFVSGATRF